MSLLVLAVSGDPSPFVVAASVELSSLDLGLRVAGAALLGGLVGLERELQHQSAGFRTHILVSLGSCLFTMAGAYGAFPLSAHPAAGSVDPTRVAAQVVAGIGFLGAGAIIRTGVNVRGLTTAAALWVTAAVGLAVGFGYWGGAAMVTVATLVALYTLRLVERGALRRLGKRRHQFLIDARPDLTVAALVAAVEEGDGRIENVHLEGDGDESRRVELVVMLPGTAWASRLADALGALEGVREVAWGP